MKRKSVIQSRYDREARAEIRAAQASKRRKPKPEVIASEPIGGGFMRTAIRPVMRWTPRTGFKFYAQ